MAQVFQEHRAQIRQRLVADRPQVRIRGTSVKSVTTFYDKPVPRRLAMMQPVPGQLVTAVTETKNGQSLWLNLKMAYRPFWGPRYICGQAIDD
jgi:hypothetical protein